MVERAQDSQTDGNEIVLSPSIGSTVIVSRPGQQRMAHCGFGICSHEFYPSVRVITYGYDARTHSTGSLPHQT